MTKTNTLVNPPAMKGSPSFRRDWGGSLLRGILLVGVSLMLM